MAATIREVRTGRREISAIDGDVKLGITGMLWKLRPKSEMVSPRGLINREINKGLSEDPR